MISQEEFIVRSNIIHNNFYEYSLVEYTKYDNSVYIICPIHGEFSQKPHWHLQGKGCKKCGREKTIKSSTNSNHSFIKKASEIHNNKYIYLSEYVNQNTSILISCPKHGTFSQKPKYHLNGNGCKTCGENRRGKIKSTNQFIEESNSRHNFKYDYSKFEFVNMIKKSIFICPKHGEFSQLCGSHIRGIGCPSCKSSKSEEFIIKFLNNKNITFVYQKQFDDCSYKRKLYFDFYLIDYNICIEFDGKQHFQPNDYFGGIIGFNERKIRDDIKNSYCDKNNIKLYRISYKDNLSESIESICRLT